LKNCYLDLNKLLRKWKKVKYSCHFQNCRVLKILKDQAIFLLLYPSTYFIHERYFKAFTFRKQITIIIYFIFVFQVCNILRQSVTFCIEMITNDIQWKPLNLNCYHLVNGITFFLSQSDHIKRLQL